MNVLFLFMTTIVGCQGNQISKIEKKTVISQKLRNDCEIIYTVKKIGESVLNTKAKSLLAKISKGETLSEIDDITVIMMMNTVNLSVLDKSDENIKSCPSLLDLEKLFNDHYFSIIEKKYTLCRMSSTLRFKELRVGYMGNPTHCSRYEFSQDPNEEESVVKSYKITSEKIRL